MSDEIRRKEVMKDVSKGQKQVNNKAASVLSAFSTTLRKLVPAGMSETPQLMIFETKVNGGRLRRDPCTVGCVCV